MALFGVMNPSCSVRGGVQDAFSQTVAGLVTRASSFNVHAKPLHFAVSAPQPLSFPTEKLSGLEGDYTKGRSQWLLLDGSFPLLATAIHTGPSKCSTYNWIAAKF